MKALIFSKPGVVEWRDIESPVCSDYGAVIRPIMVSLCSSDVHTVFGGSVPKMQNHVLGHEAIGRVIQIGKNVSDFKTGDIVAIPAITPNWRDKAIQEGNFQHAGAPFSGHQLGRTIPGVFAEYFSVPDADTTLAHIPKGVSKEQALMCVDAMTTGLTGAEYADISFGDTVCVLGIGPIGLMAVAGAKLQGAGQIIAVGSRKICKDLAKKYGATDVVDYKTTRVNDWILESTNGSGVDSVIIAGGNRDVLGQAMEIVRYGTGTISNVSYFSGTGNMSFPIFSAGRGMAGKTIHMELAQGGRVRLEKMLNLVEYGRIDPANMVTHHLCGLEQLPKALQMMKEKRDGLVKIAITMEEQNDFIIKD